MELREENSNLISLDVIETNKDYIRKTYEKLEENKKYKLRFIADQYNEGSTDATYKANYLIKEIEIITEPGVSGEIQLTDLKREGTGKNLIDVTSKVNWRGHYFATNNVYGKEYVEEENVLKLKAEIKEIAQQWYLYDMSEYIGKTVTMSFEVKKDSDMNIYISRANYASARIQNMTDIVTTEWQKYEFTTVISDTGLLGFEVSSTQESWLYLKNLQIEIGEKKTSYEPFKYNLKSTIKAEVIDKRNEIETYYIKEYKNDELIEEREYNKGNNLLEDFNVESNNEYKFDLVIKINGREYILDSQEFSTENDKEIKGINSVEEYRNIINPEGSYIVFCDLDFSNSNTLYRNRFGTNYYGFNGKIDFNGHRIIRDASTRISLFTSIQEDGRLENFILETYLNNEVEISSYNGLFDYNYGSIRNFKMALEQSTNKANQIVRLLGANNYGLIENFVLESKVSLYGANTLTLGISTNYGTIKNGYAYGENIKGIYSNENSNRDIATVNLNNKGTLKNVFSLVNVDTEGKVIAENNGNIISYTSTGSITENVYSVGYGQNSDLMYGPTIGNGILNLNINNVYYFADVIFNNTYNRKTTPLALWDTTFQSQILNSENAFNVDELISQGYYPQLNWPACMPTQEYIELPEVADKDLPDILSMEIIESTKDTAKVKFSINNPSAETITSIEVKNLQCTIESQEYKEGKSEVIAILNNPIICVSQYSVMKISTKGAYNKTYTREFKENERLIDVDFYRELNTIDDWKNIYKSPTENYILMQDLDFRNDPEGSIITVQYDGKLDGNNHTIRNINTINQGIIWYANNEIKNIIFENITITSEIAKSIIINANRIKNVHANNVKIIKTGIESGNRQGGLVGTLTGEMQNCGIKNITIINESYSTDTRIGGLVGDVNNAVISNCHATNVTIQTKNNTYIGVGGLIGRAQYVEINNCYTTGKIEIDGSNVGGLIGYLYNSAKLYNSYSYVNILGNVNKTGGIVGSVASGCEIKNNIALGNLYSSQLDVIPERIVGTGSLTNKNYAYSNQRINGYISTNVGTNEDILTAKELLAKATYTDILAYGNAYDYSQLEQAILPKLHKINEDGSYSDELLPNQEDIYLDISNEFKIVSVEIEKNAVDQIAGQIIVTNTNEAEVTGVEIDGMDVTVKSILTRDGKTYINITAKPNKFYDTYKITKVKYKESGVNKEQEVEGKIEVQFYKELYNFEDWQEIEEGTYQNYRLMSDIDFAGRTNVKTNVTMARLEGVNGNKILKNIDLIFNASENGLIKEISTNLENINFENISISNENNGNNLGIIVQNNGNINNIKFTQIEINASKMQYVGCISNNVGNISNINLADIQIYGNNYTGGFIGSTVETEITDINISDFTVFGYDYVGGIFGIITGIDVSNNIGNMKASKGNVSGYNCTGGIIGKGSGNNYEAVELNVSGNSYVGGIIRKERYKL